MLQPFSQCYNNSAAKLINVSYIKTIIYNTFVIADFTKLLLLQFQKNMYVCMFKEKNMERNVRMSHYAMYYGLFYGAILSVIALISYASDDFDGEISSQYTFSLISIIVTIGGIVFSGIHFRKNYLNNYISYGKALHFSILLVFYASTIMAFVSFIYYQWIDKSYLIKAFENSQEVMLQLMQKFNVEQSEIDQMMEQLEKQPAPTPLSSALNQIFSSTLMGAIVALITSFAVKRQPPIVFNIQNKEQEPQD